MKRLLPILLLLIYVTLTAGVTVMEHTCGGVTDTSFAPGSQEDPCGCNELMAGADRCCTIEAHSFQLDDEQKVPSLTIVPQQDLSATLNYVTVPFRVIDGPLAFRSISDPSPPGPVPATILNCTFLI